MTAPVLDIQRLDIVFGEGSGAHHAVDDLTLSIAPGERVGLVGESGCGKSTTALAIMGLLGARATVGGRIQIGATEMVTASEARAREVRWRDLAMVFQGAMNVFNPVRRVGAQIAEPMELHGVARGKAARARVRDLLGAVGLAADTGERYPHELSGGMRQRAAIAMALACEPRLLIADEPTTALDVIVQRHVLTTLVTLTEQLGLALLLITHDLGVVGETCDRTAVMRNGRIVESGTTESLHHAPEHDYTRTLVAAAAVPRDAARPAGVPAGDAVLEVDGVVVEYATRSRRRRDGAARRTRAVDGVSLAVRKGEIVALVGESGSGKTSTMQAALGMLVPAAGSVRIDGEALSARSRGEMKALRRRVQVVYQDPYESLDPRFTVRRTVAEPLAAHRIGDKADRAARVDAALERVGLTPADALLDRYPHELSGGQRQRVAIAAALVLDPDLLCVDEPVSMLDVSVRAGVLDVLCRLRDSGIAILMITHDLSVAGACADRVVVMHRGVVVEEGAAGDVLRAPVHAYTRELIAAVPDPDPRSARRIAGRAAAAAAPAPSSRQCQPEVTP